MKPGPGGPRYPCMTGREGPPHFNSILYYEVDRPLREASSHSLNTPRTTWPRQPPKPVISRSDAAVHTRSPGEVLSSKLLRAFSTRARRPDRDSRRFTTLSRSPMNIRNLSNSLGVQTPLAMASTSSPRALLAWMSSSRLSRASRST